MTSSIIQLECQCKNYPWGKTGKHSLAARYAAATQTDTIKLDESKQYAEMWMGTYPTCPSQILSSGQDLQEHLNANQKKLIGEPVLKKFGADLPYLPKILSIAKALPLQIHPDKELAVKLHEQDPKNYGDSNHKPEIAVALSKFEVFVGWKPYPEIQQLLSTIPILKKNYLFSNQSNLDFESVKKLVSKLLSSSDEELVEVYDALRSTPPKEFGKHDYIPELLPRLAEQYAKSDPGNLVALLTMNFLVLNKGEAIYVPANGIHAYLSGDIVECMARSDNVINTGFCPRVDRDSVDLFTAALKFSPQSAEDAILKPKASDKGINGKTKILAPPLSEFDMLVTKLKGQETEIIRALDGPSIMVVTEGKGKLKAGGSDLEVREGYVFFIGYQTQFELVAEEVLETHIVFCEP